MVTELEGLAIQFERGLINRRQFVAATLMLTWMSPTADAQGSPAFRGRILNHVTLSVADVQRAKDFYMNLLGATVQKEVPNQADLRIGDSFVTVLGGSRPAGIMHFCVGVEDFIGSDALAVLQRRFPQTKPRLTTNEIGQQQIILQDADGVTVELADPKYRL